MAKDPAFLFYPGDWQLGTMHLTLLEKGCYIELLVLQFAKGKFTEAQAKHMLNGSFDLAWPTLREKFDTDGTFFWNKRLDLEKTKRKKFTDSRKSNGSVKKNGGHMPKHMENKNKDEDTMVGKDRGVGEGLVYDAEKEILKSGIWFNELCMTKNKSLIDGKEALRNFHLFLVQKDQYPQTKIQLFAGFERWLLNEKKFNKNGNSGNSEKLGTSAARIDAASKF